MIVLDASAVVELLLNSPDGRAVASHLQRRDDSLNFPELLTVEVVQVFRRAVLHGAIAAARAATALADLADLDATRWRHDPLIERVFELRENLTAYDATYIALAEALDAELLTLDRRLADAPGHRARVTIAEPRSETDER